MRPSPFAATLVGAAAITFLFLLIPIVAIFAELSLAEFADGVTSDVALDALRVTAETNLPALALILAFGTPTAYVLATRRFRGRALCVTLVELPLVLPPAVAGLGLLAAFGRFELLGRGVGAGGGEIAVKKHGGGLGVG